MKSITIIFTLLFSTALGVIMPTSTNSATPSGGVEAEKARTYVKPKPSTKASYGGPKNGHGCSEDTTVSIFIFIFYKLGHLLRVTASTTLALPFY
jgi:hypothetical protein